MAALSASTVKATLSISPTSARKFSSLSSCGSVFFSYNISTRAGLKLAVYCPRRPKKRGLSCNCLFGLGVLVFGPKKLPEVGRSIGKTVKSFQQGDFNDVRTKKRQAAKEFETELKKDAESSGEKNATAGEEMPQV